MQKATKWPCGVCSKGVGSNSMQCTSCQKWIHKKCSGIKGSMSKMMKSFVVSIAVMTNFRFTVTLYSIYSLLKALTVLKLQYSFVVQ